LIPLKAAVEWVAVVLEVAGLAGVWALAATVIAANTNRTVRFMARIISSIFLHRSVSGVSVANHPAGPESLP
jgi:hypothetical protein